MNSLATSDLYYLQEIGLYRREENEIETGTKERERERETASDVDRSVERLALSH